MVELYQFPGSWTLPSISPFCLKAETWLRMAGIPYENKPWSPLGAPTGKAPYVVHDGRTIGDSTVIARELSRAQGVTLDDGMTDADRQVATLVQRTLEEHTYWVEVYIRWVDPAGWAIYRPILARSLPLGPLSPLMASFARRGMVRQTRAQGLARHPADEVYARGIADLEAVAGVLGDRPFLLGERPRTVDATVYAFVAQCRQPDWNNPFHRYCRDHPKLTAYVERMQARYWADRATPSAGAPA